MNESFEPVQIGREADAVIAFGSPEAVTPGYARLPVTLSAVGMRATGTADLEDWNGGPGALTRYFEDMETNWRGWTGAKEWRDAEATLALSATHDGKGHISLRVELQNMSYDGPGQWRLAAHIPLEAGALADVASRVGRLLAHVTSTDAD
jgi:hypothetical protein